MNNLARDNKKIWEIHSIKKKIDRPLQIIIKLFFTLLRVGNRLEENLGLMT